jgi:hypothetical protein
VVDDFLFPKLNFHAAANTGQPQSPPSADQPAADNLTVPLVEQEVVPKAKGIAS